MPTKSDIFFLPRKQQLHIREKNQLFYIQDIFKINLFQVFFWQSDHNDHKAPDALFCHFASKALNDLPVAGDCVHLHHGHPWHLILPDEEDDVFWQYYGGPQDQYSGWGWAGYSLGLGLGTIRVA